MLKKAKDFGIKSCEKVSMTVMNKRGGIEKAGWFMLGILALVFFLGLTQLLFDWAGTGTEKMMDKYDQQMQEWSN